MPRIARLIVKEEDAVYHVMSRTALDGYVMGDVERDEDQANNTSVVNPADSRTSSPAQSAGSST